MEACEALGVDPKMGLSDAQVMERLIAEGGNVFSPPPRVHFLYSLLLFAQQNILVWLQFALLLTVIRPLNEEGNVSKLLHILLVIFFMAPLLYRTYTKKKDEIMATLEIMDNIRCMRKGVVAFVDTAHLVRGDIVFLSTDCPVPADVKVLKTESLYVDVSPISGDLTVFRAKSEDLLLRGSKIICGIANAVVVEVGDRTEEGKKRMGNQRAELTLQMPTAIELLLLVIVLAVVGLGLSLAYWETHWYPMKHLVIIVLIIVRFYEDYYTAQFVVSAITQRQLEGLGLAIGNYPDIEALRQVSHICINLDDFVKRKRKQVSKLYVNGRVAGAKDLRPGEGYEVGKCCVLGNNAVFEVNPAVKERRVIGSPEDAALLLFAENQVDVSELQEYRKTFQYYERDSYQLNIRTQINSDTDYQHKLICIGNPDYLLKQIKWEHVGKSKREIDRNSLEEVISKLKDSGYSIIMAAYLDLKSSDYSLNYSFARDNVPLGDWTLGGILALNDELLESFDSSLEEFRATGFRVTAFTVSTYQDTLTYFSQLGLIPSAQSSENILKTDEFTFINGEQIPISQILDIVKNVPVVIVCHLRMNDRFDLVSQLPNTAYMSGALTDIPPMRGTSFSISLSLEDTMQQNSNFCMATPDPKALVRMKEICETEKQRRQSTVMHLWGLFLSQLGVFVLGILIPRFDPAQLIALFMEIGAVNAPCYTFGPIARKWGFEAGLMSLFAGCYAFFYVLADFGIPLEGLWTADLTSFTASGSGPFTACFYEQSGFCYSEVAFLHAQTAFFMSVAAAQWTLYALMQVEDHFRDRKSLHWGTIHITYFFKLVFLMLLSVIPKLRDIVRLTPLHFEHFTFPGVTVALSSYGAHLLLAKAWSILVDK